MIVKLFEHLLGLHARLDILVMKSATKSTSFKVRFKLSFFEQAQKLKTSSYVIT